MIDLASSQRAVERQLGPAERRLARALPAMLGVSDERGGWGFAHLPPLLSLPAFLGSDAGQALRAHHLGCFWGLTRDRIADGQASGVPPRLVTGYRRAWLSAVAGLTSSRRAPRLIRQAVELQDHGFALEQRLIAKRRATPGQYVRALTARTAWFNLVGLLAVPRERRAVVELGLQYFMLGLQCLDDAEDAAEDRHSRGVDWPTMLGRTPADLRCASVLFLRRAASTLTRHGYPLFGAWCRLRAAQTTRAFRITTRKDLGAWQRVRLSPRWSW